MGSRTGYESRKSDVMGTSRDQSQQKRCVQIGFHVHKYPFRCNETGHCEEGGEGREKEEERVGERERGEGWEGQRERGTERGRDFPLMTRASTSHRFLTLKL